MPKAISFEVWYIIIVNGTEYPQQHPTYISGTSPEDAAGKVRKNVESNGNQVIIRDVKPVNIQHSWQNPE